jgi:hypothetical protein
MDDELSRRARLLVDVAMEADTPPPAIADGSWEIVVSRLTIEAQSAPAPAPATEPPRARARWIVFVVVGMVVAATAALGWILARPRPVVDAKTPPPSTAKATHEHTAKPTPATLPAAVEDVSGLLDEAESAAPEQALELLARHAELSPLGPDSERRMALRIETLCALGRTDDAKADAVAFLGRPRDAKWVARVRKTCGAP